jgi:hypothetical protein
MNRTSREGQCPPGGDTLPGPYAELSGGPGTRLPIHAQLVREWRAAGRAVPAWPDVQWASFAGLPDGPPPLPL